MDTRGEVGVLNPPPGRPKGNNTRINVNEMIGNTHLNKLSGNI